VLPQSAAEHRAILKAIASGDAEQAGRAMYDHVMESKHRALDAAAPMPARARAGSRKG
jgi:DNA-binding FadR family transcriptional regulator